MTVTKSFALCLAIGFAAALADISGSATESAAPIAQLTAIRARVDSSGTALVIEATDPVPFVAMRPDPLTIVVEFRNVGIEGLTTSVAANPNSPISNVSVDLIEAVGAPASRVRISLAQPVSHVVRSDRNMVIVDFERSPPVASVAPSVPNAVDVPGRSGGSEAIQAPIRSRGATNDPLITLLQSVSRSAASQAAAQTAPAASSQATRPAVGLGGREYAGNPISLDFQQADLRAVLRLFAEISGLNVVIDPTVNGTVDVALRDVPWDQALDLILRANRLGYIVDGTIIRIAPITVLAEEEGQRRRLAEEQALAGELQVLTRTLSYARGEELLGLLESSVLSARGTVQVDARTNTLIISDLPDRLGSAAELLDILDRAEPQVEIEARIVQTSRSYARELGVQWGFSGRVDPALGNTTNLAFPNSGSLTGRVGPVQGPNSQPTAVNLGVGAATSGVGLAFGSVNGAFNLDVALNALEQSGNGRILSTPRVSTLNNVEAEITQGVQIPLQTIANNTVTVTFKDAALTLRVTPQITAADTVIMKIVLENATPDFSRAAGPSAIPPIDTQRAITTLLVNDGETAVIGGIYTSNQQALTNRTPGLGQIPILRWLFKRDRESEESRELLIFITPRIIRG